MRPSTRAALRDAARAGVVLAGWGVSRVLDDVARAIGGATGIPPEWLPRVHVAPWYLTRHEGARSVELHTATCEPEGPARTCIYEPIRLGRVVVAVEWSPDGYGEAWVLDARDEIPETQRDAGAYE